MEREIHIPQTDLTLSKIGLGCVGAGIDWKDDDANRMFDTYLELGGNVLDTAHAYADWLVPERAISERVVGEWLAKSGKRNEVVLVTKGGHPDTGVPNPDFHKSRLSPEEMRADVEGSLRKLGVDTIDLYFYHRDDESRPVEQLVDIMEQFVTEGKIRYYACSNWRIARIKEADVYAARMGYRGFAANEVLYNLATQDMKPFPDDTMVVANREMIEYHEVHTENLLMPYMGVCSGFFHHYMKGGADAVTDSPYYTETNLALAERICELTKKYDCSVSQAVLGFFSGQKAPSVPLYGPRNLDQLRDAMGTLEKAFKPQDYIL